jgi:hypothetical protein
MKIHGFNSALPPPDDGKRKEQTPRILERKQIDRIELSCGNEPEASYGNRLSLARGMVNPDSRIEHPTSHISRLYLDSYYLMANIVGTADPEARFRIGQTAPNPAESSLDTESVQTPSSGRRAEKLAEVRLKIAAGYYDNPEYLEKLADLLIDKLNIGKAKGSDDVSHNH